MHKQVVNIGTQFSISINLFSLCKRAFNQTNFVSFLCFQYFLSKNTWFGITSYSPSTRKHSRTPTSKNTPWLFIVHKKSFSIFCPFSYLSFSSRFKVDSFNFVSILNFLRLLILSGSVRDHENEMLRLAEDEMLNQHCLKVFEIRIMIPFLRLEDHK